MAVRRRRTLLAGGLLAALAAGWLWGLPWAAEQAAQRLPAAYAATLADRALQPLDSPSRLSEQRQFEIERGFGRLIADVPELEGSRLLFRHAGTAAAPDAYALPDGRVVLADELVALADSDAEIMAALAQALGHVAYRHGLRQLARTAPLAMLTGGHGGELPAAPRYPPAFEREADDFGVRLLRRNGYSPADLADLLDKLDPGNNAERIKRLRRAAAEIAGG